MFKLITKLLSRPSDAASSWFVTGKGRVFGTLILAVTAFAAAAFIYFSVERLKGHVAEARLRVEQQERLIKDRDSQIDALKGVEADQARDNADTKTKTDAISAWLQGATTKAGGDPPSSRVLKDTFRKLKELER